MLDSENAIQDKLNEVGTLAAGALLQTFNHIALIRLVGVVINVFITQEVDEFKTFIC
jgi:hypothetical protein